MSLCTSSFDRKEKAWAAGLAVGFAAVLVLGCAVLYRVFHQTNLHVLAVRALDADVRTLVLGSSRVMFGVDPGAYAQKTIPLAANYVDMRTCERLWRLHEDKLRGLDTVLVELDLATTYYDTRALNPYGTFDLGIPLWPEPRDLLEDFDGAVHRLLSPLFVWRLTPSFYEEKALDQGSGAEPKDAAPGFIPSRLVVSYPERYAATKIEEARGQLAKVDPAQVGRNRAAALALIDAARARKLRLVFVRFPLEPALRATYPADWHALVRAELDALRQARPDAGLELWDYADDPNFLTTDFRDPDHLNRAGAGKLAHFLQSRLAVR